MKRFISIIACSLGLVSVATAAAPKNPNMNEFRSLIGRSAFIIKKPPVVSEKKPVNNSLKLRGVSRFKSGWTVTLYDRKKPKENIILNEGAPARDGLRLISVNQRKGSYQATTVDVLSGGRQVTVGFDNEAIKRSYGKAAAAAKTARKTRPTAVRNPVKSSKATSGATTQKKSTSGRRPRVRRVKAPATK